MERLGILSVAACAACLMAGAADLHASKGRLVLAARGQSPLCAIETAGSARPNVRYAAEELRDHVKMITGVKLDIVEEGRKTIAGGVRVSVGLLDDPALGDDGFEIKSTPGGLTVRGGSRGVIYGVYELLERYGGVMWPSPDFTHAPEADAFEVPDDLSVRQKPAIPQRLLYTFKCAARPDYAVKLRLNEETPDEKWGGWCLPFDRVLGKCHTFLRMVPPDKYYESHPEYFSLVKGKRLKVQPQLCLTNPDVFDIVLSNVLERIEANSRDPNPCYRATRCYGISQDDWENYCECDRCAAIDAQEESHSGCVIWFVNKIAEAVEKKHPDVIIETLAYTYGRKPPKNIRPRGNVMICLCSIECDFSKPMVSSRYRENEDFRTNILKWREISKHLCIWDYAANWRATPVPYPNLKTYVDNIRFYADLGVVGLFEQGIDKPSASFTDLKGWIGSKLMWNPHQPAEPLIRRFCEVYYGKAAPYVLDFIKLMGEQDIDETKTPLKYAVPIETMPLTKEFYRAGRELWVKASSAVEGESEAVKRHVAWGRFGLEYAIAGTYAHRSDWRPVVFSRTIAAKLDRAEFTSVRESARYCQRMIDADPNAMLSSRLNDMRYKGALKALAESEFPDPTHERGFLQDWTFTYRDHPRSKTISRVKDENASDGRALCVKGESGSWSVLCRPADVLALDEGAKYRMRARFKVAPQGGLKPETVLIHMGMYVYATRKTLCRLSLKNAQATGAYEWYDMGEWTNDGHERIIYMDPKGATFSFDCLEISRVH